MMEGPPCTICRGATGGCFAKEHETEPGLCADCSKAVSDAREQRAKTVVKTIRRIKLCLVCGKPRERHSFAFCSSQCHRTHKWGLMKQLIEQDVAHSKVTDKGLRRYLLEVRGASCTVCCTKEWLGQPVALIMDHINGNSEDRRVSNVRLLCPNCDAQTPTWKNRNKGHGRHSRRVRYQAGLSY